MKDGGREGGRWMEGGREGRSEVDRDGGKERRDRVGRGEMEGLREGGREKSTCYSIRSCIISEHRL